MDGALEVSYINKLILIWGFPLLHSLGADPKLATRVMFPLTSITVDLKTGHKLMDIVQDLKDID